MLLDDVRVNAHPDMVVVEQDSFRDHLPDLASRGCMCFPASPPFK